MSIQDVYDRIPEIQCEPGCFECCEQGWAYTWDQETGDISQHSGIPHVCSSFIPGKGCSHYAARPFVCRIVFKCETFPRCPRGCDAGVRLSKEEMASLVRGYFVEEEECSKSQS
jgi:hypothetical protein